MASSSSRLTERGVLEGHNGWVTSIATTSENPDMIVTGSRDRSVMVWDITRSDGAEFGVARRNMRGHNHFVSDVVISNDGQFALSSSWDATLRLWELSTGRTTRRFAGHTKDALAVAFSADNRQIVSASRDRSVKLWNTLGECKYTIGGDEGHQDWVSCVRFSPIPPSADTPSTFVSCGWDGKVKVWTLSNFRSTATLSDHTGYLNSATISPDGSLCASGGRDGSAILWDLNEAKKLYSLDAGETINTLLFSPTRYWLCAATTSGIKIWDLESKQQVEEIKVEPAAGASPRALKVHPVSLAWSPDGSVLYSGWTDNKVRCHQVL